MSFLKSFFGNYSKRELKRINPIVDKILSLEDTYKKMTDAELREQSDKFRERLKNGETTDDILPEAFDKRIGKTVAEAVKKAAIESGVARI